MAPQMLKAKDRPSIQAVHATHSKLYCPCSFQSLQRRRSPNYSTICFWDGFSRWRRRPYNSAVSDIPAELCSAVVYSHVTVDDKSGWIKLTDKELQLEAFAQMRDLKRRNSKLKLLLAVGGPYDPVEKYWQLFSKAHLWKDMADSLAKWLKTYDFDGVVLDFFSGAQGLFTTRSALGTTRSSFIHFLG
ncbi:hypothetical protein MTO96_024636 [Rhipicephalus appendiculatus]